MVWKREAYIALGRYLLQVDTTYKQWDCFRFQDYTMRRALGLTFEVRHLPLSNGRDEDNFGKGVLDFDWGKHAYSLPKRVRSQPGASQSSKVAQTSSPSKGEQRMIFDVELGKLVPLE